VAQYALYVWPAPEQKKLNLPGNKLILKYLEKQIFLPTCSNISSDGVD
jgi:hypothetical protein